MLAGSLVVSPPVQACLLVNVLAFLVTACAFAFATALSMATAFASLALAAITAIIVAGSLCVRFSLRTAFAFISLGIFLRAAPASDPHFPIQVLVQLLARSLERNGSGGTTTPAKCSKFGSTTASNASIASGCPLQGDARNRRGIGTLAVPLLAEMMPGWKPGLESKA